MLLASDTWRDYELIDSGNHRKLERFGDYILSRPEPQALWQPGKPPGEWDNLCHASFSNTGGDENGISDKGKWSIIKPISENWAIKYKHNSVDLSFRLSLGSFKHVGVFPEQSVNWHYIYEHVKNISPENCRVLNLFAYTGGASLAALAAGAEVYHVDSVKQVVSWAGENMRLSGLSGIHWVLEDAFTFVQREVKRGKKYQGIILDPPAYGRGPNGEKWTISSGLLPLLQLCKQLLDRKNGFLVLNTYSLGFSSLISDNIIKDLFPGANSESGEIYVRDRAGHKLPLGAFSRCCFK